MKVRHQMTSFSFCCLSCRSPLGIRAVQNGTVTCNGCGKYLTVINGVPLYLEKPQNTDKAFKALAEATFSTPVGYELMVRLKRLAFRDATIGVSDFIRGKHVLDVGCGPCLDLPHLENDHANAKTYVGIDASSSFVISARAKNPSDRYAFAQASAMELPIPDKSFDTAIVSFAIHHIEDYDGAVMKELIRSTRRHIIILDHLRSEANIASWIQTRYWNNFDGGCNYMTAFQWGEYLKDVSVIRKVRTGAIFGHVIKLICEVP